MNYIKVDKDELIKRQEEVREDIKYYERAYRYSKDKNDTFYMKSHHRTINRLQAEFETIRWVLSLGVEDGK